MTVSFLHSEDNGWCQVSILQIILYYLYKALHNDTLPTEIIADSIKIKTAAFSLIKKPNEKLTYCYNYHED